MKASPAKISSGNVSFAVASLYLPQTSTAIRIKLSTTAPLLLKVGITSPGGRDGAGVNWWLVLLFVRKCGNPECAQEPHGDEYHHDDQNDVHHFAIHQDSSLCSSTR